MLGELAAKDAVDQLNEHDSVSGRVLFEGYVLWGFIVGVILFVNIILLNLIISLVADTYDKISGMKHPLTVKHRAEKVIEVSQSHI